jgi:16S rRNA (cytosine1402-N4)-methyltransferase
VHVPVLAEEAVGLLGCSPGKVVVDATVGGGGHAELILEKIGSTGRLIGIDCDDEAIDRARKRLGQRPNLYLVRENFRYLALIMNQLGFVKIDALLLDLGVSSFQLEKASRGFSFASEALLDMRMDIRLETTAADIINTHSEKEIANIIKVFGEEPDARRIARAVIRERSNRNLQTTIELADVIRRAVREGARRRKIDAATKTFQALRIQVNSELENLGKVLEDAIPLLTPEGRVCVISFHSLEDRIVKRAFAGAARGCVCPPDFPRCVCGHEPLLKILTPKPITPSREEIQRNPRSRSARLRAAEKIVGKEKPY